MDKLVETPGKGVRTSSKGGGSGLALINDTLAEFVAPLEVSERFRKEWERVSGHSIGTVCLGDHHEPIVPQFLNTAKRIHGRWLRNYLKIRATYSALFDVLLLPNKRLDHPTAVRMLSVLFGALGKRKSDDENATLLLACADMFSSINQSIGDATGLWKPIDKHPLILAIAIKQLIASAVFTSAAELREAMAKVRQRLGIHVWSMQYLSEVIERADEIVFVGDRAAWDAAYANIDSKVLAKMQESLCDGEEGCDEEDDDGNVLPPSSRWQAFADLIKAKRAIEEGLPSG